MLTISNLIKYYNDHLVLDNINLEVQKGEVVTLLGPSGCGKSTLLRCINGLEPTQGGEIYLESTQINTPKTNWSKIRQEIGMVFQNYELFPHLNVEQNILLGPLKVQKRAKDEVLAQAHSLLKRVGLESKINAYPKLLSGGQKQRVAIARALANHPKVLLCDEATSALDTKTTKSILALLKEFQSKLSLTIVLITHQIEVVQQICIKVCVISEGEIVERGNVEEVFANPQQDITKELISFLPKDEREVVAHLADSHNVYRIIFTGPNAQNPLISQAIKTFGVDVNILSGSIEEFNAKEVGHLVVKFLGAHEDIAHTLEWLQAQGVTLQEMVS